MLRAAFTLCLCAHLATAAFSDYSGAGEDNDLTRWAQFRHGGPLQTNRRIRADTEMQPATSTRLLISTPSSSSQQHPQSLWLLGVGPTEQHQQVYSSLQAGACQLLHTLPGEHLHWMVRCDAQAVEQLLGQHTHLTAAELPATHKLGETVSDWTAGVQDFAHGTKPWPLSVRDAPQHLHKYLRPGPDGQAPIASLLALLPGLPAEQLRSLQSALTQHMNSLVQQQQQQQQQQDHMAANCEQAKVQAMGQALRVSVCMQLVSEMAELLSQQPEVMWVDLEPRMVLHDLYANAVGQAPEKFMHSYPAPDVQGGLGNPTSAAFYPYWQAGLDGTGEVVGVVDSGLDLDSCYVSDPNAGDYRQNPGSVTIDNAGDTIPLFQSDTHRKVAQYVFFADDHDDTEGHGTHVTTAIVGAPYGVNATLSPDQATGVAPGARVALFDVGSSYDALEGLPAYQNGEPAYNVMYDVLSQAGAKVMSNSWGTLANASASSIASICYLMDNYAVSHPDMLLVFAAGNEGLDFSNADGSVSIAPTGTVTAPGSCKNMLTVGATTNFMYKGLLLYDFPLKAGDGSEVQLPPEQFLSYYDWGTLQFKFPLAQPGQTDSATYPGFVLLPGYDSSPFPLQGKTLPVIEANPPDGCAPLDATIFAPYPNQPVMVVFARSNRCNMSEAAANVLTNPNVAGGLMYYSDSLSVSGNDPFLITSAPGMDGKPGMLISQSVVNVLRQSGWSKGDSSVTVSWVPPDTNGLPPTEYVAEFSSYGSPAAFQSPRAGTIVMKPDLVAPGYTLAAASDGQYTGTMDQCMVVTQQGTSMASPQVSGAALIARQYFKKGFYPLGTANQSAGFEPSGILIKAVLIAGTAAMQGKSFATAKNLAPPPSAFQGYGRMDLAASLPLADDQLGWGLQVLDMVPIASGDTHTYTVNVAAGQGKPLIVVMAYNDPVAHPNAVSTVVNNLDMVMQPVGAATQAAGSVTSSQLLYPNTLNVPDPTNNVEKIYVGTPSASQYSIQISGQYVQPSSGQTYSLVVLGAVTSYINSTYNPAAPGGRRPPSLTSPSPAFSPAPGTRSPGAVPVPGRPPHGAAAVVAPRAWLTGMAAWAALLLLRQVPW